MKYALNILLMFTLFQSSAQNLVPNPSFEVYDTCPQYGDQISYLNSWNKTCNPIFTPDYYNSCATQYMGIPQSYGFYQEEPRGCNAYVGLITWSGYPNEREIIGTQLTTPLTPGVAYYLSFNVVWAGYYDSTILMDVPSNNIGIKLSMNNYSVSNPTPIDNSAHLNSSFFNNDSVNWIRVSGSIIADSAYNHIYLGNFYDDLNTDTISMNCPNCLNSMSYYLVDDVCISTDSSYCNGGIDLEPCSVGINELSKPDKKIIRIVDTMGRETENKLNTLLIYVYSDGTTEKVYRVE